MAETPNYLGYLEQMPKESPLLSAIQSGIGTYSALQQVKGEKQRQKYQAEKLKQEEMKTKDMPGTLERKIKTEEQVLREGELKLGALPGELKRKEIVDQQAIKQNELFLKAYPETLRLGLTSQQLLLKQSEMQSTVANMGIQDLKHNHVMNDLADIADMASINPELANKMYKSKRSSWIALGENSDLMPKEFDKKAQGIAAQALAHAPNRKEEREYNNELIKEDLKVSGQMTVAQLKALGKGDVGTNEELKVEARENTKFKSVVNNAATGAMTIKKDTQEMLRLVEKGVGQFGVLRGGMMFLNTAGQENMKAMNKLFLDLFAEMPHIGRGGQYLLQRVQAAKPSAFMSQKAYTDMTKSYAAAADYIIQKNNFIEKMWSIGIHDRNQLNNSWNKFEMNTDIIDKKGEYHPEIADNWESYFAEHLQDLPSSLVNRINAKKNVESQGTQPPFQTIPHPFANEQNPQQMGQNLQNQLAQTVNQPVQMQQRATPTTSPQPIQQTTGTVAPSVTQTGMIPSYSGQSPSSLITGGI